MSAFLGVLRTNMLLKIPLGFGLEGCEALRERVVRRVVGVDFRQGDDALVRAVADGVGQRCEVHDVVAIGGEPLQADDCPHFPHARLRETRDHERQGLPLP